MTTGGQYTRQGSDTSKGTETDTVESVTIQIDKTNGYPTGNTKTYGDGDQLGGPENKNISVSETLDTPFHLIRIYTHYFLKFDSAQLKYIKMKSGLSFKNRGKDTNITISDNVKYVYVYHFGGIPILVCVVTDASSNQYKYFKPNAPYDKPFDEKTTWDAIQNGNGNDQLDETKPPNDPSHETRLKGIIYKQYENIWWCYVLYIILLDEIDNGTGSTELGPGGTGPGNWGIDVNSSGENISFSAAKTSIAQGGLAPAGEPEKNDIDSYLNDSSGSRGRQVKTQLTSAYTQLSGITSTTTNVPEDATKIQTALRSIKQAKTAADQDTEQSVEDKRNKTIT